MPAQKYIVVLLTNFLASSRFHESHNAELHCQPFIISSTPHYITYAALHCQPCIISSTLHHIINVASYQQCYMTSSMLHHTGNTEFHHAMQSCIQEFCPTINSIDNRRCVDDKRQIDRWKKIVSRFKGKLVKIIKDANGGLDDYSISPKIRQILLHWGYELTESDLL